MNKIILILLVFFSISLNATPAIDSVSVKNKVVLKEDQTSISPVKFKTNLKEKYNSNDFVYEMKSKEKSWWDRFVEWLNYWIKKIFGLTDNVSSTATDWVLRVISTIIILFVVYLIVKSILNKEGQWIFGKSTVKKVINHEDIERNLKYIDFEKLIADTLKTGDNRLVIRYYYLWILKKLSEKELIEWNPEKTNSDYSYEIKDNTLRTDFDYASYLYNYIWYGEFELDEATFKSAQSTMQQTIKSIK